MITTINEWSIFDKNKDQIINNIINDINNNVNIYTDIIGPKIADNGTTIGIYNNDKKIEVLKNKMLFPDYTITIDGINQKVSLVLAQKLYDLLLNKKALREAKIAEASKHDEEKSLDKSLKDLFTNIDSLLYIENEE